MRERKKSVFPKMKRLSDLTPKAKRMIVFAVIGAILVNALVGPKGFLSLVMIYRECSRIEQNIALEKQKIDSLQVVQHRMRTDRSYIERASRELLGVSSSGETIIKFVDPRK